MSSFFISSMALKTRPDFSSSSSFIISPKRSGTTFQFTPNRSLSQPHCPGSPPSESRSHKRSVSAWNLVRDPLLCLVKLDSEAEAVAVSVLRPFGKAFYQDAAVGHHDTLRRDVVDVGCDLDVRQSLRPGVR